ncbi:hypothetical protein MMC25_005185 [Agyrium rufum]|nr:hypothetical protein [Agyrium rufum]
MTSARERVGHPTQFHGVPLEERAFDSQGNRLPWALEWADDHPNARQQKRQPEEKGPFGKSVRRKGSSRLTRTQTPAKKENPTLDGFEAALRFENLQASSQTTQNKNTAESGIQQLTQIKEPSQLILYGYQADTQWGAIEFYESVSGGMICEDYEREPPAERKRYQGSLGNMGFVHKRALTQAEQVLACQYKGGRHWIKVTFDSVEAADRAIASSPHQINGCWVYAQSYRGGGPENDEAILVKSGDRSSGLLGTSRPTGSSQFLGSSFVSHSRANSTHDLNVQNNSQSTNDSGIRNTSGDDVPSISSSTASSGTATQTESSSAVLRKRGPGVEIIKDASTSPMTGSSDPKTSRYFPEMARIELKPATEAFLPQPSWTAATWSKVITYTGLPKDIIGASVPRLESGEFDSKSASLYWRFFYWIDTTFGTDVCIFYPFCAFSGVVGQVSEAGKVNRA